MSSRDLESEMSKFEAELSKLTSSTFSTTTPTTTSTTQHTQNKPKISIQMPTAFSSQLASVQPPAASLYHTNPPLPPSLPPPPARPAFHQPNFNPPHLQRPPPPSQPPSSAMTTTGGIKRDASGKIVAGGGGGSGVNVDAEARSKKQASGGGGASKPGGANGAASNNSGGNSGKQPKQKKLMRSAGGQVWEDPSLTEWDNDDFRLFCGDLGNEVSDEALARAFQKYPSLVKAKVIRDKRTGKTKGYGFVSFKNSDDFIKAMREMNGKYVGNRPIKLRKSTWKDRNIEIVKKKEVEKHKMGFR